MEQNEEDRVKTKKRQSRTKQKQQNTAKWSKAKQNVTKWRKAMQNKSKLSKPEKPEHNGAKHYKTIRGKQNQTKMSNEN